MKQSIYLRYLLSSLLCILSLAFTTRAFASDPIPGVDVHLKNTSTGEEMKVRTAADGSFMFASLPAGTYSLWISQAQCAKAIQTKGTGASGLARPSSSSATISSLSDMQFGVACDAPNGIIVVPAAVNGDGVAGRTTTELEPPSGIAAPRDIATGQASGKRMHKPFLITKEWGASSPGLFITVAAGRSHELSGHVTLMK